MAMMGDYYLYVAVGAGAFVVAITLFFGFPRWFSPRD